MADSITLQECNSRLFARAKRWWTWTNGLRVGVVAASTAATLFGVEPLPAALVAGALALAAWWTQYLADSAQDQANDLRRQMDLQDGLGWPVSALELGDLGAEVGAVVLEDPPDEPYFESALAAGPRRLIENIRETGFFSERVAQTAEKAMWTVTAGLCALAVGGVFMTLAMVDDIEVARTAGAVLASVLLGVEATGVARLALDYRGFRLAARDAKERADRMLSGASVETVAAIHLAESYFIERARAPLLPDWVFDGVTIRGRQLYSGRRDALNELWRQGHARPVRGATPPPTAGNRA